MKTKRPSVAIIGTRDRLRMPISFRGRMPSRYALNCLLRKLNNPTVQFNGDRMQFGLEVYEDKTYLVMREILT